MAKIFTPLFAAALTFVIAISGVRIANADVGYDNTSGTFSGQAFALGGATGGITRMLIDDITPIVTPGTMGDVVNFSFTVFNGNATAQSVRPRARFWQDNAGVPGTYYASPGAIGYSFNPITFAANSVTTITGAVGPGFIMPQTKFWAGLTFDNLGTTTGATDTELSLFGMGIFANPVIGSSADGYFATTAAGSFFGTNNPVGAPGNFAGAPLANFGWRFESVPEPSSLIGLAFGLVVFATRNRRRSA